MSRQDREHEQKDIDKKPYEKPNLKEWGSVTELTNIKGRTFKTDSAMTGSRLGPPPMKMR